MSVEPTALQLRVRDTLELGLLVVAPAGCGKSEALALRVQGMIHRGVASGPRRILVATFSNRAKDNIRERLRSYLTTVELRDKVTIINFHGLASRLYRSHAAAIGLDPEWKLPENDWVKEQCQRMGLRYGQISAVDKALRNAKRDMVDDDEVMQRLTAVGNLDAIEVESLRVRERRLTYDDLPRMAELILANPAVATLYIAHFAAVVVDEFQDLTPQQLRIINRIGAKRTTYAGDLAQGIYGFAGADPEKIHAAILAEVDTVIELNESHRSSPAVLAAVNAVTPLTLGSELTCAAPDTWPSGGVAAEVHHQSADTEAQWLVKVARAILTHAPGHRVGVISRIGSRRRFADAAFTAKSEFEVHRWDDGVLDTETARRVRSILANIDSAAVLNSKDPIEALRDLAGFDELQDPANRLALADALSWVLELLSQASHPTEIARRVRVGDNSTLLTRPGVHLLSGHAGKGQQFDWVFVIGVEDGSVPFFEAKTPDALLEEARVLSVMMSRARHGLVLSHATAVPALNGAVWSKDPSRFLTAKLRAQLTDAAGMVEWFKHADWAAVASR
ncbi:ATP-dependent helicase [Curtobacterium sp. MCPF17_047]|uniref:UvrD-helicase domain-containing protein n=1 Tax=unclassified Curtobacterium TaxID=257496 RepID=UPI000DA9CFDA|nr:MULTISPECIES: ATP-dependent helicase [unclassified Curtobacterium]PZE60348.1 ATP-dependent helicase [Curtobacterium sp. MCPF17_001]PZF67822.1 ATP-dependent helicase [Curtobacterium sp. MCPF17_047]WIB12602.1 ATP-dependent helicase [Curtobacterium sp. MCPF17_052]